MKMTTLDNVRDSLRDLKHRITVESENGRSRAPRDRAHGRDRRLTKRARFAAWCRTGRARAARSH
jgi:hypothetical protein